MSIAIRAITTTTSAGYVLTRGKPLCRPHLAAAKRAAAALAWNITTEPVGFVTECELCDYERIGFGE